MQIHNLHLYRSIRHIKYQNISMMFLYLKKMSMDMLYGALSLSQLLICVLSADPE